MAQNIIKARNLKVYDQTHIDGRSFGLVIDTNIATAAAELTYGRTKTYLGKNKAGIIFFRNIEDEIIAVDVSKIDLIKVYKIAA